MLKVIGLGAGGHAKVLIEIIRLINEYEVVGLLDPDIRKIGTLVKGVSVLGDDSLLSEMHSQGVLFAFIGLGGVGNTCTRQRLYSKTVLSGFSIASIIHPKSIISLSAQIGQGAHILPGSIINADVRVGQNVILNSGAIIEHDCMIGDHVHIASGARLAGGVRIGEGTHIGMGASVLQGIKIGEKVIVGAGAVVTKDVPPEMTVVGVPAKPIK